MSNLQKYQLEYPIKSSSKVLYNRISTPSGLSEWFADNVKINGDIYTFIWDNTEQKAKVLNNKLNKYIRFRWLEGKEDAFFEFRIIIDDLTNDVALMVTDFTTEEEKEEAVLLWDSQIETLRQLIGS